MKNNTINREEIEKFSKISAEWWDPDGKFKPLHKFNPIRIKYIKENLVKESNGLHFSLELVLAGRSSGKYECKRLGICNFGW